MSQKVFHERVLPSPGFYAMFLLLPVGIWVVFLPLNSVLGIFLAVASYLVVVIASVLNAPQISVQACALKVNQANLPKGSVGKVEKIGKNEAFLERGSNLNARAFTKFQFGVNTLVKITLDDENDPTPYWLVSTRKPEELVQALANS